MTDVPHRGQRLGDVNITRIGVAVDIGHAPAIRVHDLEPAWNLLNGPWRRKTAVSLTS